MKKLTLTLIALGICIGACSAPADDEHTDDTTAASEALGSGTHFNFAASKLAGPSGPPYFTQVRPLGSEVPDIMCPGPTYTATARIVDVKGVPFTGIAGSCDGSYSKVANGEIVVHCTTPIEKHDCTSSPVGL